MFSLYLAEVLLCPSGKLCGGKDCMWSGDGVCGGSVMGKVGFDHPPQLILEQQVFLTHVALLYMWTIKF